MKLAVVGSINMDMTVTAERIPMKGETLRANSISCIPGGKGANQAVAGPGGSHHRAGHDHSGGK